MAEEAHREAPHRGGEETDRGAGRSRQASRNAAPAARRAEGPSPGRQEVDRYGRDLAVDVELGTRNIKIALRRLRKFARTGAPDELDLDGTIKGTAHKRYLDI